MRDQLDALAKAIEALTASQGAKPKVAVPALGLGGDVDPRSAAALNA